MHMSERVDEVKEKLHALKMVSNMLIHVGRDRKHVGRSMKVQVQAKGSQSME